MDPFRILLVNTANNQVPAREGQYTHGCTIQEQERGTHRSGIAGTEGNSAPRTCSYHQIFNCANGRDPALEGGADKRSNNTGYTAAAEEIAKEDAKIYANPSRVIGV